MGNDQVETVAKACRVLGKLDATHGAYGHVSVRTSDDSMLIKGKGKGQAGLRSTQVDDVIEVTFDVKAVDGRDDVRPPSESFLHAWIYRARPEVQSVVHMHPESALLLTIHDLPLRTIYGAYGSGGRLAAEGIRTYPSSLTISDHERGQEFAKFLGESRACLMRAHGVAVVGDSIEDATVTTMVLKELTDITYKAYLLGGEPPELPATDLAEVARPLDPGRALGSAGGRAGVLANWSGYCQLAEES